MGGGVVAVHAHPDDETLATGALLATFARAGLPATVVTCTRGERGEVIGEPLAHLEGDGPALAAHREGELAAALAALGVDGLFLDTVPGAGVDRFEDSGMAWVAGGAAGPAADVPERAFVRVPLDDAAERLAVVLRSRRPDVVATYEPGGGYGHPDHVRAHEVTMRAVALAGLPVVVLWAAQGRSAWTQGVAALPPVPGFTRPAPADAASVVVDDTALDLVVDVAPVRTVVLGALRAHATQVQAVTPVDDHPDALVGRYALSNRVLAPVLPAEAYRVAVGDAAAVAWPDGVRRVA